MARLAEEKIKEIAHDFTENKMVKNKEPFAYEKLLLDAQIEHIRQQSGMKLIDPNTNVPNNIFNESYVEWVAEQIRYADTSENPVLIPDSLKHDYETTAKKIISKITQAQLASDQLVIDKRVEELEAQVKELIVCIESAKTVLEEIQSRHSNKSSFHNQRVFSDCGEATKFIDEALAKEGVGKNG